MRKFSQKNLFHCSISNIKITNFRNINNINYSFSKNLIAFIGNNGVGKTNILETISLASPGRGLRNAKIEELENFNKKNYFNGFNININFYQNENNIIFRTYKEAEDTNRKIELNHDKIPQTKLSKYINIIWLTPLLDSIFVDSKSERRKFFDRICFNLFPEHLKNLQRYEHYQRERLRILQNTNIENKWLDIIEKNLGELNSAIASVRVQTIKYLNAELEKLASFYPKAFLYFDGIFENMYLNNKSSLEIEQESEKLLKASRADDKLKKQTAIGIHKTDFICEYAKKNMPAKLCSTGEQKSLLLSIIMSEANLLRKNNNRSPILLIDEILSHLDEYNAKLFIEDLINLDVNCFITSTSSKFIENYNEIEIIKL
jgi:DNA replication and repair protein RecF